MISPKEIMVLNMIFSSSLGVVALCLLAASIRRLPLPRRGKLSLSVRKEGILFRTVSIGSGRYRIGRGRDCDILLDGMGIPMLAGEIVVADRLFFRAAPGCHVTKNNGTTPTEFEIVPGDEVGFFTYSMRLENG